MDHPDRPPMLRPKLLCGFAMLLAACGPSLEEAEVKDYAAGQLSYSLDYYGYVGLSGGTKGCPRLSKAHATFNGGELAFEPGSIGPAGPWEKACYAPYTELSWTEESGLSEDVLEISDDSGTIRLGLAHLTGPRTLTPLDDFEALRAGQRITFQWSRSTDVLLTARDVVNSVGEHSVVDVVVDSENNRISATIPPGTHDGWFRVWFDVTWDVQRTRCEGVAECIVTGHAQERFKFDGTVVAE